jgi:hypothetical protein
MRHQPGFAWKLCSGLVIALMVFSPFTEQLGVFVQTAQAAEPGSGGLADTPNPPSCGNAFSAGPAFGICTDAYQAAQTIEKVKSKFDYQMTFAAMTAFWNAATYFAQTIAYDTAEWASNGFKGQAPGIYTDPFGTYTQNLVLDSVGEFMGSFSKDFVEGAFGFDLCKPPQFPQLALEFAMNFPELGLTTMNRPHPKCSWTDIVHNWDASAQSLSNLDATKNISSNFTVGGNDVSFGIGAHMGFFDYVAEKRYEGIQTRVLGGGYKDVSNFLSGSIETPAETVRRSVENSLIENPANAQNINTGSILSQSFSIGGTQLGILTASTFVNVLVSKLLQKVMKGLFKSSPDAGSHVLPDLANPNAAPVATQKLFASAFSDLKTPKIISTESQDLLTELSACPSDVRTKWNCAMDETMAAGLRQGGLTLRQAIDQTFINENWQLIPSARIKDNQDPSCRSRAFCTANLRKLRLARIIPIGWELAAESPTNQVACVQSRGCVTLKEAMARFDDCLVNKENPKGILDKDHPYCHLVDPNWVLAALPAQCLTKGYGNQLIAGTSRIQECQDTVMCLQRDKDGKCTGGFGYCMAEQTYWQFDAQSCKEQNASCRTYTPRGSGAKAVSYLRSTLDYGSCNASNVGCMWYATKRVKNAVNPDSGWTAAYAGTTADRIYLNKNVQACSVQNDGCTSLRKTVPGQPALNLVRNGSFENVTGTTLETQLPVGWRALDTWAYSAPQPASGSAAEDGNQSLLPSKNGLAQQIEGMRPSRQYTLSFYARRLSTAGGGGVTLRLTKPGALFPEDVSPPSNVRYYRSPGCSAEDPVGNAYGSGDTGIVVPIDVSDEWTRFSCTFVTTPDTTGAALTVTGGNTETYTPLIDAIQLEETENPTSYIDGLNPGLETVNLKVPPEELGCTGDAKDDPRCASFARVCRQSESGCQGYRAVNQPSLPEVPAVLTQGDLCPAECVGYAEFRKQPSMFDLTRSTDTRLDDPEDDTVAAFIPSTAQSCAAQDVGCERFTDVEAASQGGGGEIAMNYLRACEKPGPDSQTYYTWEGSDTTGYQLKTWSLKRDIAAPAPQPPRVIVKTGADGVIKDPTTCNLTSYLQAFDPDCRQFYDPQGNTFYAFESQTVLSSETCRTYRKDASDRADCEKTGGTFNPAANQCTYLADQKLSLSCDISNAGCRAYVGTTGKAQSEELFEDFTSAPSSDIGVNGTAVSQSDEAVLVGDKSLKLVNPNGEAPISFPLPVEPGVLYELTFWAKTTDPSRPDIQLSMEGTDGTLGSVKVGTEWNTFRIGPFVAMKSGDAATKNLTLTFRTAAGKQSFIDKVRVERVQDKAYVVKDSWNTPTVCDQTPEGIPQPQVMLGCKTYADRTQKTVNARQFTRLCRDTAIGCTTFVNTRNTETSYSQSWTRQAPNGSSEVTIRAADQYDYYIEEKTKQCAAAQVGCRAFGLPNFTQDRLGLKSPTAVLTPDQGEPFKTVYLKDVATSYDTALCSEKELFCESFTSVAGTDYFRAPADHACEYRTAAVVDKSVPGTSGATFDGWFRVGTDMPCYPDQLKSGSAFGILFTGDTGYNGWNGADPLNYTDDKLTPRGVRAWTGLCPDEEAECTEFRDVNDTSDPLHKLGRPYYVVNDSKLDKTSCGGQVDPGRGCVLFRDMSSTSLTFSTKATNESYKTRAYQPVPPLDCANQQTNPSCEKAGMTANDSNIIVKVKADRACSEWLACSTGETVYDPQVGQYKGICTDLKLCNKAGEVEGAGVPFCSNYVDRTSDSELLRSFNVVNAAEYSKRATGFGTMDYSGVTVPDQFQLMDTKLVPIGNYVSTDPSLQSKYKKDYRLAVPVPGTLTEAPSEDRLKAISGVGDWTGRTCVLKQNGSMGFWQKDTCWMTVNQEQPPEFVSNALSGMSENLNVPFLSAHFRSDTQANLDQVLNKGFPNTQCKAAPESDSPFGNEYVVEWDATVTPAIPKRMANGYGQTNICEFGEACACTYKRVQYGGKDRFFEPLSTNVLTAMCVGGPRDGQSCLPNAGIGVDVVGGGVTTTEGIVPGGKNQGPRPDQQCGDGACTAIKKVSLVRGITGQCLQYDISRVVAGDQTKNECLLWNPNPILTGPGDQYHWMPTAGFKPPQTSGRYYCTSPVRAPQTFSVSPIITYRGNFLSGGTGIVYNSSGGNFMGLVSQLYYDDDMTSEGGFATEDGGGGGGAIDKVNAENTDMGRWCEEADDDQSPTVDFRYLRLVTTGYGSSHSYAEYTIPIDPRMIGGEIGHSSDIGIAFQNSLEDVISNFTFAPMGAKLGCGYSEDFVDGVGGLDYDDSDSWTNSETGDPHWQAWFPTGWGNAANGRLDRRNAQIVTEDGTPTGVPVKVTCGGWTYDGYKRIDTDRECYLKTWQLDYRADGQEKFQAFSADVGRPGPDSISTVPLYGTCPSDHSWFSIRAMFEDTDSGENSMDPTEVNPLALTGPFQIVGLWVTACSPFGGPRYIYMSMNMGTSDVCRELAETVSKDSHDAMAFTDRNSANSGFTIPRKGFTWGITNIPFGASLATRDAGTEPLYMSGVKQASSNPLHPPAFTYPGQTYFSSQQYPTNNWGLLSNVFARIFRVYGYYTQGVSRTDWACTSKDSPEFGQWCPNLDKLSPDQESQKQSIVNKFCGYSAKCVKGSVSGTDVFSTKVCNTFSGVNRGLDCSSDPDICHRGPQQTNADGVLAPSYRSCAMFADKSVSWSKPARNYHCSGDNCPTGGNCSQCKGELGCSKTLAIQCGALRCSGGSVRDNDKVKEWFAPGYPTYASNCTNVLDESPECPEEILGETCEGYKKAVDQAGETIGHCMSHQWAECKQDSDCSFTARNFWTGSIANTTFKWGSLGNNSTVGRVGKNFNAMNMSTESFYINNTANGHYAECGVAAAMGYGCDETKRVLLANNCPQGPEKDTCIMAQGFPKSFIAAAPGSWPGNIPTTGGFFALPIAPALATDDGRQIMGPWSSVHWPWNVATIGKWDDSGLIDLFPGFAPNIGSAYGTDRILLSMNFGGFVEQKYSSFETFKPLGEMFTALKWTNGDKDQAPYGKFEWNDPTQTNQMIAHYAACEPLALMFQGGKQATKGTGFGTCNGGTRAGSICLLDKDCQPKTLPDPKVVETWCNPVTTGEQDKVADSYKKPDTKGNPDNCWQDPATANDAPNTPAKQSNPALDNNLCTHPPGYWPRPNWCPNPNDEYCGLMGYDLGNLTDSVNDSAPLPTDVTPGLYSPKTLNDKVSGNPTSYNYIQEYKPSPPVIAAPDMRSCNGGQCKVVGLGTMSIDGLAEGVVNGGAGSHVATLRFYAWAAHDQMPLRRIMVDWGDGTQTELPDAYMKNHKPYCQTEKECLDAPGLTCGSDTDCPPGAGTCEAFGTCNGNPNKRCHKDTECGTGGKEGTCNPRTFFGNDEDACDQQYFEFRHAYTCLPDYHTDLECPTEASCSSNPGRLCVSGCAPGDRCVSNMAQVKNVKDPEFAGCFVSGSNTCRFTPRVMVIDNWGWCTGECRNASKVSGGPVDNQYSRVLHPNGGCFDATRVKSNIDVNSTVGMNECDPQYPARYSQSVSADPIRPWIVFPGSVQLLTGKAE